MPGRKNRRKRPTVLVRDYKDEEWETIMNISQKRVHIVQVRGDFMESVVLDPPAMETLISKYKEIIGA